MTEQKSLAQTLKDIEILTQQIDSLTNTLSKLTWTNNIEPTCNVKIEHLSSYLSPVSLPQSDIIALMQKSLDELQATRNVLLSTFDTFRTDNHLTSPKPEIKDHPVTFLRMVDDELRNLAYDKSEPQHPDNSNIQPEIDVARNIIEGYDDDAELCFVYCYKLNNNHMNRPEQEFVLTNATKTKTYVVNFYTPTVQNPEPQIRRITLKIENKPDTIIYLNLN